MFTLVPFQQGYVKRSDANALACSMIVSSSCITMPGPILDGKLMNCCRRSSRKSGTTPSPYSQDLVHSDYFPFPKLTEHLSGTRYSSDSDMKTSVDNWLNGHGRDFYKPG
ncbi:hypothetical protein AVEN_198382-1 [Araneus ventricosus]|uniref:Uncharacterized protein n=1 Tax=Araneus ventricosus TaxID=182803 RepID=A0A4Y2FK70_ARAVE|nr:hypothetical protein AVEN_198382-1 [Araneus ventricosus]